MAVKATKAFEYLDQQRDLLTRVSDTIWRLAEVALHEERSAACLAEALRAEGFSLELGVADMPSAFVATWGGGRPVLGLLGEYDALAGLSQKTVPVREELVPGAPGHGCGHNLLGVGALGAAIGLKRELEAGGLPGTVRYYGCPAEENLSGKAFMARAGLFDDCDACLTWHPGTVNRAWTGTTLANNAANFTFHGRSAHAAGDPHHGRSALDAVQLMNLGVEFLREHMPPKARVHYVITSGGGQPNVVPPVARVWYLVRAPRREQVDELWERVLKCAAGAAEMTETSYEMQWIKAIWNVLPNPALESLLEECLKRVGPPEFGPAERGFAAEIGRTIPREQKIAALREDRVPEDLWDSDLVDRILDRPAQPEELSGSTDVGDVSWCCPVGQVHTACEALGTPGHSWQTVAQSGMGIGHAGMLVAAKALAEAGFELMTDPGLLARARADFERLSGGRRYRCAMPADHRPAFDQFATK